MAKPRKAGECNENRTITSTKGEHITTQANQKESVDPNTSRGGLIIIILIASIHALAQIMVTLGIITKPWMVLGAMIIGSLLMFGTMWCGWEFWLEECKAKQTKKVSALWPASLYTVMTIVSISGNFISQLRMTAMWVNVLIAVWYALLMFLVLVGTWKVQPVTSSKEVPAAPEQFDLRL